MMETIKNVINTTFSKYSFGVLYLKLSLRLAITMEFPILLTFRFANVLILYESLKTVLYILLIIWLFERK